MAKATCSVEDCDRPQQARGWCPLHWARWRRHGDPTAGRLLYGISLAERFWPKVDQSDPDGCWPWTAYCYPAGYGQFLLRPGRPIQAHRVAWMLTHGPIPPGLLICHRCDNRPCCKPTDLFLGTHADNTADMMAKGRNRNRKDLHGAVELRG